MRPWRALAGVVLLGVVACGAGYASFQHWWTTPLDLGAKPVELGQPRGGPMTSKRLLQSPELLFEHSLGVGEGFGRRVGGRAAEALEIVEMECPL